MNSLEPDPTILPGIEAGWLTLDPDPAFIAYHRPVGSARSTAVLMCPPFGWETMISHRPWWSWANALAAAGHPTARLSFPGTGDSAGGPRDPDRLDAWTEAALGAASWLRDHTGATRVAAIGIGLGGAIAYRATAFGAPIDELVLWSVPAAGRRLVRELKAYAAMVAARDQLVLPPPPGPDLLVTGYRLSGDTVNALQALNLDELPLPARPARRALLLSRDGLAVDEQLRTHLEAIGTTVRVASGNDYAAMMFTPQGSELPSATVALTLDWLAEPPLSSAADAAPPSPAAPGLDQTVELGGERHRVRESSFGFAIGAGSGFGIFSEPIDAEPSPVWAVVLNSGALNHTGPNRSSVEVARRWASRGVPTARIDLEGVGEADGEADQHREHAGLYAPKMISQTLSLLDQLDQRGGPGRYLIVGTCSGAYLALQAGLADPRVAGVLAINLYAFAWSEQLTAERDQQQYRKAMHRAAWVRLSKRDFGWAQVRTGLRSFRDGTLLPAGTGRDERAQRSIVETALDRLRDQGTETLLVLSENEPLREQLAREGRLAGSPRWPNLTIEPLPTADHQYRDPSMQAFVHQVLDHACERVLRRLSAHPPDLPEPHTGSAAR